MRIGWSLKCPTRGYWLSSASTVYLSALWKPASLKPQGAGPGDSRKHLGLNVLCQSPPFPVESESPLEGGHTQGSGVRDGGGIPRSGMSRGTHSLRHAGLAHRWGPRGSEACRLPLPLPGRGPDAPPRASALCHYRDPSPPRGPQATRSELDRPAHPEALPQLTPAGA